MPQQICATTDFAAVIQGEISALAEADVAATETDGNPWAVAEDEERHHEADDLVSELKIQLKAELEQPEPAAECQPIPSELSIQENLSPIVSATVSKSERAAHIHVFRTRIDAMAAIQMLEKAGFDTRKLSLIGPGLHSDKHTFGFYAGTDGIRSFGSEDAFWGGVWALLLAPSVLFIPGLGLMGMAGPLVSALVGGVEGAVVVGGLSALGLALKQVGVSEAHAVEYEAALKLGRYVLITHGTAEDAAKVNALLMDESGTSSGDSK